MTKKNKRGGITLPDSKACNLATVTKRVWIWKRERHVVQWFRIKNSEIGDFPSGPVVKNLPYNAGDVGSIPGQGTKIPHAVGQLNPRATTTELMHPN